MPQGHSDHGRGLTKVLIVASDGAPRWLRGPTSARRGSAAVPPSLLDQRHPDACVSSSHPVPAGLRQSSTSALLDQRHPQMVAEAGPRPIPAGFRQGPAVRFLINAYPDGCVGSPHPVPGGRPEAILTGAADKTPGQQGLWTTFSCECERMGHSCAATVVRPRGVSGLPGTPAAGRRAFGGVGCGGRGPACRV
jgi:hypothetical protein